MSGNSCESALQTAPMVSDLRGASSSAADGSGGGSARGSSVTATSARQVRELVLADLELVAVLELVRVDPAAVHVGPVQRSGVVEEPAPAAVDQDRVVAGDGDVVE